ncbi:ABC-2 type transport system permease protein [Salirhabdus euzebyi]|uniref:ABC-2 type transport system permease protein n=1 Tax=Salirhabdus euzebyi TaxID=394506 RepID=A0A841Q8C6_9BACI|nr:ABC transporter permease [Salirhabdus euzebyi]MBB6454658.1 ABC-2 type transport system permease protein [Salirhabdus euzebyi]
MNKFGTILRYTYFSHLKSKSFIIMTAITLLLILGLTNFNNILNIFGAGDEGEGDKIAVLDESNTIFAPLQQSFTAFDEDTELVQHTGSEEEAKAAVKEGEFEAFVHVALDEENIPTATLYAMEVSNSGLVNQIQQALSQVKIGLIAQQANLDQETMQEMFLPVDVNSVALQESAKTEEELSQARGLVYFMLFLIYFAVLVYGNMIASEVAIEKSSRVMEIIISSVSPITQMFAKIIGIALLGLTQFSLIILIGYTSLKMNQSELVGGMFEYFGLSEVPISTFVYAIVFFILGYLLYAMLAAMLGSLVSRIEDVQQTITPMVLLVVAAFMIAMFGLNDPDSTFVTITSFIPFFTPIIMFMRVGMLDVPLWEVGISIGILMLTIYIFASISARVYKGGVLMYGRTSSLKDIKKAIQLTKKG